MLRNNLKPLSPIPEEGLSSCFPSNVRKNAGGREDDKTSSHSVDENGDVEASGEDVEASGEGVEASGEDVEESREDVEESREDEEQIASESVAKFADGSPEADSSSLEDVRTPEAMRRQRKPRLTDIIPFGGREHSVVKDVTPPAGILAKDLSGASADSPSSPLEGPVAASSPYQRTSQEPDSPSSELVIEVETKRYRRDSDSEEFFKRLEKTMGKLARKYILNEEDDTWSFDSGVQIFESSSRNYFDDYFTEGNVNGTEAQQNVERVASDSRVECKGGIIDRTKSSELKSSEAIERSRRPVLKDITPPTRKLTMPRIADEEVMQIPLNQSDDHRDKSVSMHSSGVLEEEQSSNDDTFEQDMEEHASEILIEGEPKDEGDDDEESLEENVEQSGSDSSAEATGVPTHSSGELEAEEDSNEEELVQKEEQSASVAHTDAIGESEEEDSNKEEPVQKVEQSASEGHSDNTGETQDEEEEEDNSKEVPEEEAEPSALEATGESEEQQKGDNNEEQPMEKVKRSSSETLADASDESSEEEDKTEEEVERVALEATVESEEGENNEENPVEKFERSGSECLADALGESAEEEENSEGGLEKELEQSVMKATGESAEEEEKENSEETHEEELELGEENSEEASEEEIEHSASKTTGKSENEEGNDEDAPKVEVERSQLESIAEDTGKLEGEESNAETSREAVEQMAECHAVKTDARKEPEMLSSPDIRSPEVMRRRRRSKITTISPVEKSKYSELKDSTPPARTLSVQRISDEGLIQHDKHIGDKENEEADTCEENQEEEEQATLASFARASDASPILSAASSKSMQRKSSLEDFGNYFESSDKTSHAQKMKRMPIRDVREEADIECSFKRRRIFENRQSKDATDLDEIVPFYPIEDPTHTNRKESVEAFISPAATPTKERVSPIISTGRAFVTRRKPTRARIAMMTQSCSPLSELNIETTKKYPEADSDSEEFFNRLEKTMTKLARKYILKIEDDTESFDSGVLEFERLLANENALDSDDD